MKSLNKFYHQQFIRKLQFSLLIYVTRSGFLRKGITIFCWGDNQTVLSVIFLICVRVCWRKAEVRVYVPYICWLVTRISNWCKFILSVKKQKILQNENFSKEKMPILSNNPILSCFKMERWMTREWFPKFLVISKFKHHSFTVASIGSFQITRLIVNSNKFLLSWIKFSDKSKTNPFTLLFVGCFP